MARQSAFGDILRDTRKRKGLDLSATARRLRIRPDILQAIEESDFARMPPRGYTRNMISAYARLLGLNPQPILQMYLDQAYAFDVGRVRNDSSRLGNGSRSSRSSRVNRAPREDYFREESVTGEHRFGRALYNDRPDNEGRTYAQDRVHPSRHTTMTTQYTNFYAGPRSPGVQSKLPFIIAGAIIVILLIVVMVLIFGRGGDQPAQNTETVPISGLTDTSNKSSSSEEPTETAPTFATVDFEVSSGNEAYIEVYLDDSNYADMAEEVTGPATGSYQVSGSLRFVTTSPDYVTLTVDGKAVELTDDNSSGVYTYTVEFSDVLAQWQREHGQTPTRSSSTSSDSSSSSSSSKSKSSSSSSSRSSSSNDSSSSSGGGSVRTS